MNDIRKNFDSLGIEYEVAPLKDLKYFTWNPRVFPDTFF